MAKMPVILTKPHKNAGKPFMHNSGMKVSSNKGGKKGC